MNLSVIRRIAALLAVLTIAFTLSACYQQPGGVLQNPDEQEDPIPTLPAKEGQLTLSLLLGVMRTDMKWSDISSYTHTDVDASHATFAVADNYGKECVLSVTYAADTDVISEAILSYGDTSVNVLSDNTLVIRQIMIAMSEE